MKYLSLNICASLQALKDDHHVLVASGLLAECKEGLVFGRIVPGIETAHVRELDDDDPFGSPMRLFREFMTPTFGQVSPAISRNHRTDLDSVLFEPFGIRDDVLGDIECRHLALRSDYIELKQRLCRNASPDRYRARPERCRGDRGP